MSHHREINHLAGSESLRFRFHDDLRPRAVAVSVGVTHFYFLLFLDRGAHCPRYLCQVRSRASIGGGRGDVSPPPPTFQSGGTA